MACCHWFRANRLTVSGFLKCFTSKTTNEHLFSKRRQYKTTYGAQSCGVAVSATLEQTRLNVDQCQANVYSPFHYGHSFSHSLANLIKMAGSTFVKEQPVNASFSPDEKRLKENR